MMVGVKRHPQEHLQDRDKETQRTEHLLYITFVQTIFSWYLCGISMMIIQAGRQQGNKVAYHDAKDSPFGSGPPTIEWHLGVLEVGLNSQ